MFKQQLFLICGGLLLLASLLFLGTTVAPKDASITPAFIPHNAPSFDIDGYIIAKEKSLVLYQKNYIGDLANSVKRGNVKDQQIKVYDALAGFWGDSAKEADIANYYKGKSAELVNSEKNLTFAARLILDRLRGEQENGKRTWEAEQAIGLLDKAIALDPNNDDLKVDLASCYVFGKGMAGDPMETMKGVRQLLDIVERDPNNMKAQLVLGIGGVISTQYNKAIQRLTLVVTKQPDNLEAVSWLADAYAAKGDKANAIKWYEFSKRLENNPQFSKEVDERIRQLQ
jgi:tetratricopeptide (TPR) repeat protein